MFSVIRISYVNSYNYGVRSYVADYVSDVANLPTYTSKATQSGSNNDSLNNQKCMPGSRCKVCEDGSIWILNNQNEWIEQPQSSSDSNSESEDEFTEITADEVSAMLE